MPQTHDLEKVLSKYYNAWLVVAELSLLQAGSYPSCFNNVIISLAINE
ncbi:hypothetical protein M7I_3255 [Glarea lozoyensis 74030]|uniref:Uncharacterized protein n=1 Tax=Glarea lozoyensis (strain ATCC 74030 / MF5533) TaxID=1104152 RepID=H0EL19_GLAL7|nr:hypothetical protein M7I_3255 [Glarea lozoyensis 74030]